MVLWFLDFILSLVCMIICYITNPIVVLFCDDDGELPGPLKYWQTWDNSCNPSDITHILPDWLDYNWDQHYREYKGTTEYLRSVNRERWFTECIDNDFTVAEILKRYVGRVWWLTRNCSYGFSFYLLGLTISPTLKIETSENTIYVEEVFGSGLHGAWMYKNTAPIFSLWGWTVRWNNLLGWKIDTSAQYDTRAMIANRIAFSFEKEAE